MTPNTSLMPSIARKPSQRSVRAFLTGDETFATTLLLWVLDAYGPEALDWHPLTLKMELEQDNAVTLPKVNLDKLMAAIAIVTTDLFWRDGSRFIQVANALSGDDFQPNVFAPADSIECAWAITEAMLLCPPDSDEPFSDEVRDYIGFVLKDEGYITPPDVLRIGRMPEQVKYDFSDDPQLFEAVHAVRQDKTEEVEAVLRDGLEALANQLEMLPLQHGNTKQTCERIRKIVAQKKEGQQ